MLQNQLLLTADIGGSKTLIRIYDAAGTVLYTAGGAGFGSAEDADCALPALSALLQPIAEQWAQKIGAAAVNLGGKNQNQITAVFRNCLPRVPLSVSRESEGCAAKQLALHCHVPIVLLAGTGSICSAFGRNQTFIAGGWGANIGDEGSGYAIGLSAIRRSLRELDGCQPLSQTAQLITGRTEPLDSCSSSGRLREQRDQIRSYIGTPDRKNVASKTLLAAEAAEAGDPAALQIFAEAGTALGELVLRASGKIKDPIPGVLVTGGLTHCRKFWSPAFEETIGQVLPVCKTFLYLPDGLITGVYYEALDLLKNESSHPQRDQK